MKTIVSREVLGAYGVSPEATILSVGGTKNSNFCVRDGERTIFLRRRHPDYCEERWIRFDHEALNYLAKRGAPINEPLPCPSGGTWFQQGDDIYEAYPWVSGNAFPGTKKALYSVAEKLAVFHKAGESYPGRYDKGGYRRGEMAPKRLLGNIAAAKGISEEGDEIVRYYISQVELGAKRLNDETYHALPATLVHGDIQPANAIFDKSCLLAFVDYDWMAVHPAIYDLAFAIILFCSCREMPINGVDIWSLSGPFEFDEKLANEFLATYTKIAGEFPPQVRPAFMEQVRLSWAHIRIDGARKVPAADRPRFLARDLTTPFEWIEQRRRGDWL